LDPGPASVRASSADSFQIRPIVPRRSVLDWRDPAGELSLRCLRLRKLRETNTNSPPWARRCSWRLLPAELADGLALSRRALLADHRETRPNVLGPPLPGVAGREIRRAPTYHKARMTAPCY